jgi:hypothetical protein
MMNDNCEQKSLELRNKTLVNSIQFFIIYVPSQQPLSQLQTQHSTDIHNYNGHTQHKVKGKLQEHIIAEKQTNK